jgi:hypothetical protein
MSEGRDGPSSEANTLNPFHQDLRPWAEAGEREMKD